MRDPDSAPAPLRVETLAIHAGQEPDPQTGAVMTPVYQTSTYAQDGPGQHRGHEYARTSNPTRTALEACLAALEGGRHGIAFASGCAATTTLVQALRAGDHVVSMDDVYGGTWRIFERVWRQWGLETTFTDLTREGALEAAIRPETRMAWIETPTNPLLKVADIARLASVCRERGVLCVVDNTFASPVFQSPLALGADVVVHSTTKYVNGHSDVVGGIVVTDDDDLAARLRFLQNASGAVPGPWDAWLTLRGVKTLPLRMERHAANAARIVEYLDGHPEVARVIWPGHPDHPQHAVARRQMRGFGGMIAFELKGDLDRASRFVSSTRLFTLAESLGGVESLIELPAVMTHATIPPETRRAQGIADGLIRLSVGIEHVQDLVADLDAAFTASR
ncbi:cystathionine gamma-synthase [Myxococcota bacterium]|nr:cystathionine gamma-synthase [Myxococcota bacterium]